MIFNETQSQRESERKLYRQIQYIREFCATSTALLKYKYCHYDPHELSTVVWHHSCMYCKWQRDPAGANGPALDPNRAPGSVPVIEDCSLCPSRRYNSRQRAHKKWQWVAPKKTRRNCPHFLRQKHPHT